MARPQSSPGRGQSSTATSVGPFSQHPDEGDTPAFSIRRLPVEIQIQIWTHVGCALEPRIVEVSYQRRQPYFVSRTLVPPLLHLCSASRRALLQKYKPLEFGTYFTGTYVDWDEDTIFFNAGFAHPRGPRGFYTTLKTADASALLSNCKRVAIGGEALQNYIRYCCFELSTGTQGQYPFMDFVKLLEVTEVLDCPDGEGNISFERNHTRGIRQPSSWSIVEPDSPSLRLRRMVEKVEREHASRANRMIQTWIASARRGEEMRLKGKAKAMKWEGVV